MVDFNNPLDNDMLQDAYAAKREVIGDDLARPRQFVIGRINEDGTVSTTVTSGEYGRVWVRQPGENTGDAVEAINNVLQPHEVSFNRPVLVKKEGGEIIIVRKAPESANYDAQIPTRPQRVVDRSQIRTALIYPSQPDSSFYAYYAGGIFQINDEAFQVFDNVSSDFSISVPGSNAISIKVELDPETQIWYETTGDPFTTTSLEQAMKDGALDTDRTQGRFLLGWIRLYAGQTAIQNEDILMAEQMVDTHDQFFAGAWNGTFDKNFDFTVSSNGTTVTGSLVATNGGDLTAYFNKGRVTVDTDPTPETVTLTPGTDTNPQINHVYVKTNDILEAKTSTYLEDWPTFEHAPVAIVILRTALTTQTDGALGNQNINNRPENDASNNQGWIQIAGNNIRSQGPKWLTGVTPTITIVTNGGSPDNVYLSNTSGQVRQFNPQTFPALDMQTGDDIHVVNNFASNYVTVSDLNTQLTDSTGTSMSGKYFWLTFWGIINKSGTISHLMCNVPSSSYNTQANAQDDVNASKIRDIPTIWGNTGFLISETLFRHQAISGGTWTEIESNVLLSVTGGDGGGTIVDPITSFSDAVFDWYNSTDPTKIVDVDLSGLTTATTRTWTAPDKDGTVAMLDDVGPTEPHLPQGRLSLTSGDPNDESDTTSSTLYYVQSSGNTIMLYNILAAEWEQLTFNNTSLSLAALTANTLYDFFGYNNSGSFALEAVTWGTNTAYNISAMTAADPCVITYLNSSPVFSVGDDICIQGITGSINTVTHIVTSVTAIGTVSPGVSYSVTIEIDTTGLTYTSGGTVRLLKNTRATAISSTDGIPTKAGGVDRRYLGTGLIGGDGGEMTLSTARVHLANYYNRVHRKIRSSLDVDSSFLFAGGSIYQLPGTPNECNDGQGRISYVAPYNGTDLHGIWATGAYTSVAGIRTAIALEQNTITNFAPPSSDNAFTSKASDYSSVIASLFDNNQNEGYNYIQQMVFGGTGANHTVWVGGTVTSSNRRSETRGYINA
jgi:hypothetical protein